MFDLLIKLRRYDTAEEVLKSGLEQNPQSVALLNAKKQLEMEKQIQKTSDESS